MRQLFPHLRRFGAYVLSGSAAAVVDIGTYFLLIELHVWYIAANVVGGVLGFFTAFLLNKYLVFQKNEDFLKHLFRYFVVDMCNLAIMTGLLYLLVDKGSFDPRLSKFVVLMPMVLWNFFVYKLVVYI